MNQNPDPHVYFIRPIGADGPIKVGHSIHAKMRLRECMKWSPIPLEIVAMIPIVRGQRTSPGDELERRFHLRYADYRLHHEWFDAHTLILADIEAISAGTFDTGCLPEWKKVTNEFIRRPYRIAA